MRCLLGAQTGRVVDVSNSFEIRYRLGDGGAIEIDVPFFLQKQEQCRARAAGVSMEVACLWLSGLIVVLPSSPR